MQQYHISGVPITDDGSGRRLVGILTNRDLRFETNLDRPIAEVMTKDNLVTAPVGTTLEEAERDPAKRQGREAAGGGRRTACSGLITVKDIQKRDRVSPTPARTRTAGCGSARRSARAATSRTAPRR